MANPAKTLSSVFARHWWNLERFGFTPAKLRQRSAQTDLPRVVCNCIPKSGTHLLERTLCLHPGLYRTFARTIHEAYVFKKYGGLNGWLNNIQPGQMYFCHLPWREETEKALGENNVHNLFMIRDLRDVLISDVHYIRKNKNHYLHELFSRLPDMRACLELSLRGDPGSDWPGFGQRMQKYMGWLDTNTHVVRFEDLIGSAGGGDSERQHETLNRMFRFLGIELSTEELQALATRVFSDVSPTFRKGRIGTGISQLDPELKSLFKEQAGELLIRCGYEKSLDW